MGFLTSCIQVGEPGEVNGALRHGLKVNWLGDWPRVTGPHSSQLLGGKIYNRGLVGAQRGFIMISLTIDCLTADEPICKRRRATENAMAQSAFFYGNNVNLSYRRSKNQGLVLFKDLQSWRQRVLTISLKYLYYIILYYIILHYIIQYLSGPYIYFIYFLFCFGFFWL